MPTWYQVTASASTPPSHEIDSGETLTLDVRSAFADIPDLERLPTPYTPDAEGHPLAPIAGPIRVRNAEPGDSVVVELLDITPHGEGMVAILRNFGVLRAEFARPAVVRCPIKDGAAWFGGRIALPLLPNLGTVSTMPPAGGNAANAGAYGGDMDQRDVRAGSRIQLPVLVPGALVFVADPHAVVTDGLIAGTGVEADATVTLRILLRPGHRVSRPLIEIDDTLQVVGWGPTLERSIEDACRGAVDVVVETTGLGRAEAYMLLSAVGELRVATSPRPVMATRVIIPTPVLRAAAGGLGRGRPTPWPAGC